MKSSVITAGLFAVIAGIAGAAEMPGMPKPQKEHEWLKQVTGEWEYDAKITMEPGKPAMNTSGTEVSQSVGGFWTVSENNGEMMGSPFKGIMTLGYSPEKSKYIGTWVDSMQNKMWEYEGTVDESGKKLTLHAEGPCPMQGGKMVKFQESLEIKSPDHKVFSSKVDMDGKWVDVMHIDYKRKK